MTPAMEALRALGMLAVIALCITLSVYLCKGWRWLESEGKRLRRANTLRTFPPCGFRDYAKPIRVRRNG